MFPGLPESGWDWKRGNRQFDWMWRAEVPSIIWTLSLIHI